MCLSLLLENVEKSIDFLSKISMPQFFFLSYWFLLQYKAVLLYKYMLNTFVCFKIYIYIDYIASLNFCVLYCASVHFEYNSKCRLFPEILPAYIKKNGYVLFMNEYE